MAASNYPFTGTVLFLDTIDRPGEAIALLANPGILCLKLSSLLSCHVAYFQILHKYTNKST